MSPVHISLQLYTMHRKNARYVIYLFILFQTKYSFWLCMICTINQGIYLPRNAKKGQKCPFCKKQKWRRGWHKQSGRPFCRHDRAACGKSVGKRVPCRIGIEHAFKRLVSCLDGAKRLVQVHMVAGGIQNASCNVGAMVGGAFQIGQQI